jgi:phosphoglycerate dehydrogenase-like enzyme
MIRVAVTNLEYNKASDIFKNAEGFECLCAPTPEKELAEFITENKISHVIIGVAKYTDKLYDALPHGGVIARFGVGHDGVDKKLAAEKGLFCTNTPGVLDDSVAECAVGLMLTAARQFAVCMNDNKNGTWKNRVGSELSGKTLAVIGCGNIGRKVAKIAKSGFDMQVIGFDITKPENQEFIDEFTFDFATAVEEAEFITVHIPDIAPTQDFINAKRLSLMKPSAILINTARGGILDENALYDAVKSGIIGGAALDVFKNEPYIPQDSSKDLRTLDNVLMTPHIGSSSQEACSRMACSALKNIELCEHRKIKDMSIIQA